MVIQPHCTVDEAEAEADQVEDASDEVAEEAAVEETPDAEETPAAEEAPAETEAEAEEGSS